MGYLGSLLPGRIAQIQQDLLVAVDDVLRHRQGALDGVSRRHLHDQALQFASKLRNQHHRQIATLLGQGFGHC